MPAMPTLVNHGKHRLVFVVHVTQLGVSRSKQIRFEICRSLHIYGRICFELSTLFGQPEDAYMGLVSMVHSHPRQSLGTISPLFSGYTISLTERVSGEQRGGAAELLSRIGGDHGN